MHTPVHLTHVAVGEHMRSGHTCMPPPPTYKALHAQLQAGHGVTPPTPFCTISKNKLLIGTCGHPNSNLPLVCVSAVEGRWHTK